MQWVARHSIWLGVERLKRDVASSDCAFDTRRQNGGRSATITRNGPLDRRLMCTAVNRIAIAPASQDNGEEVSSRVCELGDAWLQRWASE